MPPGKAATPPLANTRVGNALRGRVGGLTDKKEEKSPTRRNTGGQRMREQRNRDLDKQRLQEKRIKNGYRDGTAGRRAVARMRQLGELHAEKHDLKGRR